MAVRKLTDEGVSVYPLDIAALEKGDFIPPEMVEEYAKVPRNHPRYQLSLLALKDTIRKGLHRMGRIWTLASKNGGIRVLTDPEASLHNRRRWNEQVRAQGRTLRDNLHVDTSLIEDEGARRQHEQDCISQSRQYAAAKQERRKVALVPHRRATPTMASLETSKT